MYIAIAIHIGMYIRTYRNQYNLMCSYSYQLFKFSSLHDTLNTEITARKRIISSYSNSKSKKVRTSDEEFVGETTVTG